MPERRLAAEDPAARVERFAAEMNKLTRGGTLNVYGERMDEEGACHCGVPGERWTSKPGFWCSECVFAVHDTCWCSNPSSDEP